MPTPIRTVRVPDETWRAAVAKAVAEGTSVSAVIVEALQRYITPHAPQKHQRR